MAPPVVAAILVESPAWVRQTGMGALLERVPESKSPSGDGAAEFHDKAILQITLISSWFNYMNRVADALGVGQE
jgi:alkylhydroperoxidase family enzyme